jgi:hypothetical protein
MQEKEFNHLMNGQPAKWADDLDMKPFNQFLNDNPVKLTLVPGESKKKTREKIKANEKPVPGHIREAISKYVKEERAKKVSERVIRRAVKRKWNIYVV